MKRLFLPLILVSLSLTVFPQNNHDNHNCGQHKLLKNLLSNPSFLKMHLAEQKQLLNEENKKNGHAKGVVYQIPIVFHLVHNNGSEKIERAQILDALAILNRDMRGQNPDTATVDSLFQGIIADNEIEFVLATKAPDGSCFSGVTRTLTPLSFNLGDINGSDQVNAVIALNDVYNGNWPGDQYLNVFVCGAVGSGIAGYTYYPSNFFGNSMENGIWLRHDYCGSIGTGSVSSSRTFAHEVGHWLNLPHTWGSTNEPGLPSNCSSDDGVADTPNTIGSQWCNYNETTCGSHSNIENYMEYSSCRKMFTNGQKSRMRTALNSNVGGRNNLCSTANLAATGIDVPPPFCQADFFANSYITCSGDSILFEDDSYHNPIGWQWSFQGGNPSNSILPTNYVTYDQSGTYDVDLTATADNVNFLSNNKPDIITVLDYDGVSIPYYEGFESTNLSSPVWFQDNNTWEVTNQVSYNGANCLKLNNNGVDEGTKHFLESQTFDLSGATKVYFSFKYAFSNRYYWNDDKLKILASNDCGETWSVRKVIQNSQLITAENTTSFNPLFNQWEEASVTSIVLPYFVPNFRFKLEFISGGGNDFFIDNLNISFENVTGLNLNPKINSFKLFPNPANSEITIEHPEQVISGFRLMDVSGKEILVQKFNYCNQKNIDISSLAKGYYFMVVESLESSQTIPFFKK
jgi:hypothetical protein